MIQNMINADSGGSNADGSILLNDFNTMGYPEEATFDFGDNDIPQYALGLNSSTAYYFSLFNYCKALEIKCNVMQSHCLSDIFLGSKVKKKIKIKAKSIKSGSLNFYSSDDATANIWLSKDDIQSIEYWSFSGGSIDAYTDASTLPSNWAGNMFTSYNKLTWHYGVSESAFDAL